MSSKLVNLHSLLGSSGYKKPANSSLSVSSSGDTVPKKTNIYKDISLQSSNSEILHKVDIAAVKGAIRNLLQFMPGQRPLDPKFGNTIRKFLYEGITPSSSEKIGTYIRDLFIQYEPRVIIDDIKYIKSDEDTDNNTIRLIVYYHIVGFENQNLSEDLIYHIS